MDWPTELGPKPKSLVDYELGRGKAQPAVRDLTDMLSEAAGAIATLAKLCGQQADRAQAAEDMVFQMKAPDV